MFWLRFTSLKKQLMLKCQISYIAHEPTFYKSSGWNRMAGKWSHLPIQGRLLAKNGIAVWRNHGLLHSLSVDGVAGWSSQKNYAGKLITLQNSVLKFQKSSLRNLINHIKSKMQVPALRYAVIWIKQFPVFTTSWCHGRRRQITGQWRKKPDVIIVRRINPEWETPETYETQKMKWARNLSLIVIVSSKWKRRSNLWTGMAFREKS